MAAMAWARIAFTVSTAHTKSYPVSIIEVICESVEDPRKDAVYPMISRRTLSRPVGTALRYRQGHLRLNGLRT